MFWIICVLMTLVAGAYVAVPLIRTRDDEISAPDVEIYKAQLAEIDRDLARDVIAADEAERAKVEVSRRLLAASKVANTTAIAPQRSSQIAALAVCATLLAIAIGTYVSIGAPGEPDQPLLQRHALAEEMREARPSQAELALAAPPPPEVDAPADYLESVAQLRQIVPTRPDDIEGWKLLAFHETELRRYSDAVVAQKRVIELSGDGVTLGDKTLLIDLMVAAADGIVSPEAEEVARDILRTDQTNIAGLYYIGSLHNQNARPDISFRLWRPIVESGQDAFHVALARAQIENAAARAGVNYVVPAFTGPDLDQIAAAEDMTEEERNEMVGAMVAGLADRLANQGGPAGDWARLITAYGVLGDTESATTVWLEARQVFGSDDQAMVLLREAAAGAGIAE